MEKDGCDSIKMETFKRTQIKNEDNRNEIVDGWFSNDARMGMLAPPLSVKDKFIDRATDDLLRQGKKLFDDFEESDATLESGGLTFKQLRKNLYDFAERYREVIKRTSLVIIPVGVEECDFGPPGKSLNYLTQIYENTIFAQVRKTEQVVKKNDFLKTVRDFIAREASKSKLSTIFLNSVISRDRLELAGDVMYLQELIAIIQDLLQTNFKQRLLLPVELHLVFNESSHPNHVTVVAFTLAENHAFKTQVQRVDVTPEAKPEVRPNRKYEQQRRMECPGQMMYEENARREHRMYDELLAREQEMTEMYRPMEMKQSKMAKLAEMPKKMAMKSSKMAEMRPKMSMMKDRPARPPPPSQQNLERKSSKNEMFEVREYDKNSKERHYHAQESQPPSSSGRYDDVMESDGGYDEIDAKVGDENCVANDIKS